MVVCFGVGTPQTNQSFLDTGQVRSTDPAFTLHTGGFGPRYQDLTHAEAQRLQAAVEQRGKKSHGQMIFDLDSIGFTLKKFSWLR